MNALWIIIFYYVGFAIAYLIAYRQIKRFKTNDSLWLAAFLSWITVIVFIGISIYRLFKKDKL